MFQTIANRRSRTNWHSLLSCAYPKPANIRAACRTPIKEHLPGDVINSGGSGEVILDAPERKVTFLGDVADCLVKIRETLEIDTIGLLPDLRQLGC